MIVGLTVLMAYIILLTYGDNEGLISLDEASFCKPRPGIE